jgi:hypothetical protein
MIQHPAVVVHGLPQARAALQPARPVTLLSARGAAIYAGCAWWAELIAAARELHPDLPVTDILDCADAPGRALAALRIGQLMIRLDAGPALADIIAAADSVGAQVLTIRPPSLDLAQPGALRRLPTWLGPPSADVVTAATP